MNKFFSLFLSLSLILAPMAAHAGESKKAMDNYTKEGGTGSSKGTGFYMLQAGMLSVAAMGAAAVACVPSTYIWSHYIFAGGAAAFIAGELALAGEKNDYHKRKKDSLKIDDSKLAGPGEEVTDKDRDLQTTALQAAYDEEANNKKMMEKRKKWATATAIIYDLAAVAAAVEGVLSLTPVYTGFLPDALTCAPVAPIAFSIAEGLIALYAIKSAVDHSGGKIGLSTVGFALLIRTEVVIAVNVGNMAMINAWGRIGYFAAAAIAANLVVKGLKDRIEIAETNMQKIDAALKAWKAETSGTSGIAVATATPAVNTEGGPRNTRPESNYLVNNSNDTNPKSSGKCLGISGSQSSYNSGNCKKSIKFNPSMPKFDIAEIGMYTKQAMDFANASSAGNMEQAGISADGLIANAARIRALKDQVIKDAQTKLDAQGGPKQDLLASIDAQHANMMKQFAEGAEKSGFGSSMAGTKATLDDSDEEKTTSNNAALPTPSAPSVPTTSPVSLYSGSDSASAVTDPTGLTNAEKDLISADYAENKNAYLSAETDSIFEVVTKTYQRNLDRILVRKKKPIPEVSP